MPPAPPNPAACIEARYQVHTPAGALVEVCSLALQIFKMDGGGLFGVVPRPLWQRAYALPDAENRVPMVARALAISGADTSGAARRIVCDFGLGGKLPEKRREIFAAEHAAPERLAHALDEAWGGGATPTDALATHLHFDHAGGLSTAGHLPALPATPCWVHSAQLAWARRPSLKDAASYAPENWEPLADRGLLRVLWPENDSGGAAAACPDIELIAPWLWGIATHGHTAGMVLPLVRGEVAGFPGSGGLLFGVDTFPTWAHLKPHYLAAFDNAPLLALAEKQWLLERAGRERWLLVPGHDPDGAPRPLGW